MLVIVSTALLTLLHALCSLATPVPIPLPLALMASEYSNRILTPNRPLPAFNWSTSFYGQRDNSTSARSLQATPLDDYGNVYHTREQRGIDALSSLYGYYSKAKDHSSNLKGYASQSAQIQDADLAFQQNAVSELTAFDSNLLGIKTILDQLGAEKGLLNYDRNNDLETLLKNVVNFNKETLNAVDVLVYNLPILGPLLGPIVYEIKCLLDDVLNAVENLTDALINGLQPLLIGLIGQASTTACKTGVEVLGLCI